MTTIKVTGGVHPNDAVPPEQKKHFNQQQLSRRWDISPRTLEKWRSMKIGPSYLRLCGKVCYRLEDIETFEASSLHVIGKK